MTQTITGTANRFNVERGYGFIRREDGPDVFLHASLLLEQGIEAPPVHSRVTVEARNSPRGLIATRVVQIEPPALDQTAMLPARVKFYDPVKGYGFAKVFGRPDQDVYLAAFLFDDWPLRPQDGEAIAIRLEETPSGLRAAEAHEWTACREVEA